MQALRSATAVFCLACICAEVLTQLVGEGWPRRCIKAAAGLYILVVLVHVLPGVKAEMAAFSAPSAAARDFGTAEEQILLEAQSQLAQTLAAQCREETGVEVSLQITLAQKGTEVSVSRVEVRFPAECSDREKEDAVRFLRQALGVEPVLCGEGNGT